MTAIAQKNPLTGQPYGGYIHNDTVYAFMYCPDNCESCYATMSLHRTRRGAEMAMEFHKQKIKNQFEEVFGKDGVLSQSGSTWDLNQSWAIREEKIQE